MTNFLSDFVIKLALILLLSSLPSLVYLLVFRQAKARWQMRLRRAQILTTLRHRNLLHNEQYRESTLSSGLIHRVQSNSPSGSYRRPVTKYYIGDTTCINNAHSPYLRCAINPSGPCDECAHYEKRLPSNKN